MAAEPVNSTATETGKPLLAPVHAAAPEHVSPQEQPNWLKYATPLLVMLLAATVALTISRNWN